MFAAGSRAEVTAVFKPVNGQSAPVFPRQRPPPDESGRPWRVTEWKLGAAVRKEARGRRRGQAGVRAAVWKDRGEAALSKPAGRPGKATSFGKLLLEELAVTQRRVTSVLH